MGPGHNSKWYKWKEGLEELGEPGPTYRLEVHRGLEGFGDGLDELRSLFAELQRSSGDIADPELDLLTFANAAHYFGVLTKDEVLSKKKAARAREAKANRNALLASSRQRALVEAEEKRSAYSLPSFRRYDTESWASSTEDGCANTVSYLDKVSGAGS
jgi:hypothetical protein